ncbi:MAG TPA: XrtB/PEP-CTERM-associated polysaccharide biosynthesis outer membrane protein EpsL [Ramlibacter sp.]|nr:XrtB/PEP-CTERM-associated polysaccharide biosynthesis outer membrane protein EpsL [Ramlibacter sp.]
MKKLSIPTTVTLASLIMLAPAAFAQESLADEGLHFGARLGVEHDSNVLRTSAGTVSDTAWTAGVGLRYNKQFSLQKLHADVEWDTWRYSSHSGLNFNTLNYALGWDWSITPRFHGTLSADRRQFREVTTDPVAPFANHIGRRTERNELAEAGFGVAGPWRLLAGVSHYKTESSQPGSWDASPDITFAQVGVGYEAASGSTVNLRFKRGKGDYHDPTFATFAALNTDFRDTEEELAVRWLLSGKTTLDGRIAHVSRRHENAPGLDFSGMAAALNANWDITAKTRLAGGWVHDISASGLPTGGHVESDRLFISPVWQATAKTSFNLRWDHTRREWKDAAAIFPAGRADTLDSLQAGVDWNALRTITVSGYVRHEKMSSSINPGYRANVYGVLARANF